MNESLSPLIPPLSPTEGEGVYKNIPQSSIDDKLFTVKYKPGPSSHLIPDQDDCRQCETKACNYFCPANVYHWDESQKRNLVAFENCFECGACRLGCVYQSIDWFYPKDGCGVTFRHG